jgi:hypothetical protein
LSLHQVRFIMKSRKPAVRTARTDKAMDKMPEYKDVEKFLCSYSTETPPFHFGRLLNLVLAGIENMREHATELDLREHAHFITEAQALFIQKLLDNRAESIEWFKDHVGHSSQTGLL